MRSFFQQCHKCTVDCPQWWWWVEGRGAPGNGKSSFQWTIESNGWCSAVVGGWHSHSLNHSPCPALSSSRPIITWSPHSSFQRRAQKTGRTNPLRQLNTSTATRALLCSDTSHSTHFLYSATLGDWRCFQKQLRDKVWPGPVRWDCWT